MTLLLALLLVQDDAKAKEALDAAAAVMKDADTVRVEIKITLTAAPSLRQRIALKRPNLARVDGENGEIVFDGKTRWMTVANQRYLKQPQREGEAQGAAYTVSRLYFAKNSAAMLEGATKIGVRSATLEEAACTVVSYQAPWGDETMDVSIWLDDQHRVRREVVKVMFDGKPQENTVEFGTVDLAPNLPGDAFTFKPADGATELKLEDPLEKLIAVGAKAPDFSATDLDGRDVALSTFKGKTVVLNFWFLN